MTRDAPGEPATATVQRHRWHTAASYDQATGRIQRRNAALVARLHPEPATVRRALDIGCGTGALTEELLGTLPAARITALDVSADMLARARTRAAGPHAHRVEFQLGSFLGPQLFHSRPANATGTGEQFDAAFSNAALHWMYPRYDDCFTRVHRLLVPGGLLCMASAGRSAATDAFDRRVRAATEHVTPGTGEDFTQRRMTADEVTAVARRNRLEVDDVFLVERRYVVSAAAYATWWLASGGPWQTDPPQQEHAVELLAGVLGGPEAELEMVHASVFAVLRRPK
ncbi:class I SAM-dependent methyltransferase [Streptomyces camelliae]|uniref:Class I SAM-dependent methyltransferase n=1 Tax=Streptomyces camelliae TaxID=3004093 RepID=A0ABY7PK06_9ACTN|nr:class I SAM-dependent methyltransferase [Streptomyces sp. HUAS 2-6]WBO69626.1 class I SAM-dependent methyltransferase [Streptomyces sp. HUAS 2-6]